MIVTSNLPVVYNKKGNKHGQMVGFCLYLYKMYDYGARFYDPQIGRWTTVDPHAEKYLSISTYTYCYNNPLKLIDLDGKDPGDFFKTKNGAAKDWGMYYNGRSILKGKEYSSSIYLLNKNGVTGYTYTEAAEGISDRVKESSPPDGKEVKAIIHSHGEYLEGYINDDFSNKDKWHYFNEGVDGYVTTPDGSLKKYDPNTGKTTEIDKKLPSDPKDPDRKNKVKPTDVPAQKEEKKKAEEETKKPTP